MKVLKTIICILFSIILCIPILRFNFATEAISEIDNRKLAENPLKTNNEDFTVSVENYVNDRIGFRSEIITAYTILNDMLFGKMVHPSYTYGQDGYVFGAGLTNSWETFSDYHKYFAQTVKQIEDYCEERDVPFVFVFNPAKPAVLEEYVPKDREYERSWVEEFISLLDKLNINYVDNTVTLKNEWKKGNKVFNKKYDANHWNDLGAFYGTNAILENLSKKKDNMHINSIDEFYVIEKLETSLLVSKFPINENVPIFNAKNSAKNIYDEYLKELKLNPSYKTFGYYINEKRETENAPKVLVFQGSYMNGMGYKFLANSFSEYIYVHDYQNVLDFDYYYNIFKPDCVIFEVAEYTFSDNYFSYEKMKNFRLNPLIENIETENILSKNLNRDDLVVKRGETLTEFIWKTDEVFENVWFSLEDEYDMRKTDDGYCVTLQNSVCDDYESIFKITVATDSNITVYS